MSAYDRCWGFRIGPFVFLWVIRLSLATDPTTALHHATALVVFDGHPLMFVGNQTERELYLDWLPGTAEQRLIPVPMLPPRDPEDRPISRPLPRRTQLLDATFDVAQRIVYFLIFQEAQYEALEDRMILHESGEQESVPVVITGAAVDYFIYAFSLDTQQFALVERFREPVGWLLRPPSSGSTWDGRTISTIETRTSIPYREEVGQEFRHTHFRNLLPPHYVFPRNAFESLRTFQMVGAIEIDGIPHRYGIWEPSPPMLADRLRSGGFLLADADTYPPFPFREFDPMARKTAAVEWLQGDKSEFTRESASISHRLFAFSDRYTHESSHDVSGTATRHVYVEFDRSSPVVELGTGISRDFSVPDPINYGVYVYRSPATEGQEPRILFHGVGLSDPRNHDEFLVMGSLPLAGTPAVQNSSTGGPVTVTQWRPTIAAYPCVAELLRISAPPVGPGW